MKKDDWKKYVEQNEASNVEVVDHPGKPKILKCKIFGTEAKEFILEE